MKCIYCGSDMQLGGIVTQGVSAMWFPQESLKKSRLSKIIFEGGIAIPVGKLVAEQAVQYLFLELL